MNKTPWLQVGDSVSVSRWDAFFHPSSSNRIGSPAVVTEVTLEQVCETGVMVKVKGTTGRIEELDMNWIKPHDKKT